MEVSRTMLKKLSFLVLMLVICSTSFGSVFAYDVNNVMTDEQKNSDLVRISELENSITEYNLGIEQCYNDINILTEAIAGYRSEIKKIEREIELLPMVYGIDGFCACNSDDLKALQDKIKALEVKIAHRKHNIKHTHETIVKLDEQNYIASQEMEFLKTKWGIKDPV